MITYEPDPEVVRWGLQLFNGPYNSDPSYANCAYCGVVTQNDPGHYHGQYFKEEHYDTEGLNVENDELIAHALQEQLSQLAVAEEPGSPHEGELHLPVSDFQQDWLGQSIGNYGSGQDYDHEEAEPSSSCSSLEEKAYCGEDWSYSLELTDESALDGEVGKRLNQMVPVPSDVGSGALGSCIMRVLCMLVLNIGLKHVPRINGEIPSIDEATLDHQRLLDRLQVYDLVECKVRGDGNCQFRALSDQFYRTPEHHEFVRQEVVNQLKSYPEIYEGYVPMAYGDYLEKMSKSGEWGDHVTLQAAADSYGVKIFVITSFKDTCYIEILPNVQRSKRVIFLSFWAEVHYNSIYPLGEVPAFEPKRKRSRMFRNKHLESPDIYQ